MANNTWKNYTQKNTALSDNDEVMLLDSTDEKNKRGLMSKFWDYVVDKMATAVISKLETENKTVIGAINALKSESRINLLRTVNENGFSETLKGNNYKMTVGYFSVPHDNPFSFVSGYYLAFQSDYLAASNAYTIVGIDAAGNIECKSIQLT